MDLAEYRPVLSGLLGGLAATLLCAAWARWLPKARNGKSPETLLLQHRLAVKLAHASFLAGIGLALAMYGSGAYRSNDWRPIALGAGLALTAPLVVLPLVAWWRGGAAAEAYVAFALHQRTPMVVLYPLLASGIPLLAFAVARL